MIREEWKTIKYATNYEVSNLGNIRHKGKAKPLKPYISANGYYRVCLITNEKQVKHKFVHRLVAETFIPNPLNKSDVNHKDYNKLNNNLTNLEWMTRSENNLWSGKHISESAMRKIVKVSTRQKISNYVGSSNQRHLPTYIYKNGNYYTFIIKRLGKAVISKSFKTLEETIEYKMCWLKEHKNEIIFYYKES